MEPFGQDQKVIAAIRRVVENSHLRILLRDTKRRVGTLEEEERAVLLEPWRKSVEVDVAAVCSFARRMQIDTAEAINHRLHRHGEGLDHEMLDEAFHYAMMADES